MVATLSACRLHKIEHSSRVSVDVVAPFMTCDRVLTFRSRTWLSFVPPMQSVFKFRKK
jgi:hypothetical protein